MRRSIRGDALDQFESIALARDEGLENGNFGIDHEIIKCGNLRIRAESTLLGGSMSEKPPQHACVPHFTDSLDDVVPSRDDYLHVEYRPDTNEPFKVHHGDTGVGSYARVDTDGTGAYAAAGPPSRNEDGSDVVAKILARRKNLDGDCWLEDLEGPSREEGVDWILRDANGASLDIQVTRVVPSTALAEWGKTGQTKHPNSSVETAVEDIRAAIDHKRLKAGRKTVLALDARHPNFHALPDVVEAYIRRQAEWQETIHYLEIWIVGLTERLTFRLK